MTEEQLIKVATEIRNNAYVPYSKFPVGAALQTKTGKVYTGCNIENAAFPVTCCAERVAIFKAISNGETEFFRMAVVADTKNPVAPCGSCRQVMSEFFDSKISIYLSNLHQDTKVVKMEDLLPFPFQPGDVL